MGQVPSSGTCPMCGAKFELRSADHVFCSKACWNKARYRKCRWRMISAVLAERVPRKFACARCGKEVTVSKPNDKRTRFCSERCEKLYWKKPHRKVG